MTPKVRVMARHRGAVAIRNPAGGWDVRSAGNQLLGQGSSAGNAWWDAWRAMREAAAPAAPAIAWPFPLRGRTFEELP